MRKNFFVIALLISIFLGTFAPKSSQAYLGIGDFNITDMVRTLQGYLTNAGTWANNSLGWTERIDRVTSEFALAAMKAASTIAVNSAVRAIVGSGNNGQPNFVTNWNDYLYLSPHDRTMLHMNSFFNSVSGGRLSSSGYEGFGGFNYDAYMATMAMQSLQGQAFTTTLSQQIDDPTRMFEGKSMRPFLTYLEPANNVWGYTSRAQQEYAAEFAKQQKIAEKTQVNGWLPKITANGKISAPATLFQNAMESVDRMGNDIIVNATTPKELAIGSLTRIAAQTLQAGIGGESAADRVRARNANTSLNLNYNPTSGLSMGVNGQNYSTGVGTRDQINNLFNSNNSSTGNSGIDGGSGSAFSNSAEAD